MQRHFFQNHFYIVEKRLIVDQRCIELPELLPLGLPMYEDPQLF